MTYFPIHWRLILMIFVAGFTAASVAHAETPEYRLVIKNHSFIPDTLTIPAGVKIRLIVVNEDPTPEEFESYDFNREKIVGGYSQIKLFVGPLKPGVYKFFGEFNMETAQGRLIVE